MILSTRRFTASCLVAAAAAVAVPLLLAGSAHAALAGANPLTTTNRPDLRTVTLTSASTARFCFDQTVAQVPSQSAFSLGGYSANNFLTSTNPTSIAATNNKCVDATFPVSIGDTGDLTQFTFGQVGEGAVLAQVGSGFVGNRSDSTALAGSNTNNGTAGHTVAPDLTGVVVDNVNTGNTLDFIYDQNVQISSVDTSRYTGYYQDGTSLGGVSGAVAGGNVVKVTFSTPLSDPVHGPAVIGVSRASAVRSQTADHTASTTDSAAVAGTAGATTTKPDLISATLSTDGTFVDFMADKPLGSLPLGAHSDYEVWLSTGIRLEAGCVQTQTSADGGVGCVPNPQLPNNVARANYSPGVPVPLDFVVEYAVKAAWTPGAAQSTVGVGNGFGEAPIGDNQGAFASGFTTGPDAFTVTFDNATNTATVLFDQAVYGTTASKYVLLDANGTPLPGGTGVQAGPVAPEGTTGSYQISVSFTGASVANAKALEIQGPMTPGVAAASTDCTPGCPTNVQQIISPTGHAAVLMRGAKVHWVRIAIKHHSAHKSHKRHKR